MMPVASEASGSFPPLRSTSERGDNFEAARLAQQQIQDEVEQTLQKSTSKTLHELFDPQELESANIARMWRYHQLRPQYKDFVQLWAQADSQEIADVEFWYAYWYQEKKILERIARQRDVVLGCVEMDDRKSYNRLFALITHNCLEAPVRLHYNRCAAGQADAKAQISERTAYTPRMGRSDPSLNPVALWRWGTTWLTRRVSQSWRGRNQYRRLDHSLSIRQDEMSQLL